MYKASRTQAQVLALLSLTELQRYKPRLKERRLCPFVPYMYITTQEGPHYGQPSGKYLLAMLTAARGMHCRPDQLACMKCVRWEQRRRELQCYVYSSCAVCKLWV